MYADPDAMRFLEDGHPLDRAAAFRSMAILISDTGGCAATDIGRSSDRVTGELELGRAGLWQPEGWPGLEVGVVARPGLVGSGLSTTEAGLSG